MAEGNNECKMCKIGGLKDATFFSHFLGKRHKKTAKLRRQITKLEGNVLEIKDILVRTNIKNLAVSLVKEFLSYGLVDVFLTNRHGFLEFQTKQQAQEALKKDHIVSGRKLSLVIAEGQVLADSKQQRKQSVKSKPRVDPRDCVLPPIGGSTIEKLKRNLTGIALEDLIIEFMHQLELKPAEFRERENVRFIMENFLRALFPNTRTFIFGSSANNLGFSGCDIDMVADLGFNIWATNDKATAEKDAADLTNFLAKKIRRRKRGYNVVGIARARVPIIKFNDFSNGIEVDLSFKNGMPIFNTSLIKLYTSIHPLVRPYMMLLRSWAKIQGVAGGGKPNLLITNYCLAMMMIFVLMRRNGAIVPCVGEIQEIHMRNNPPVIIDGWNCSISENVHKWRYLNHSARIIDLVIEFFEFYGQLDSKEWVISPLAGTLVPRADLASHRLRTQNRFLQGFIKFKIPLPLTTALCVQDPFEQSHNIARGLTDESLKYFQHKCCEAARLCKQIRDGKKPLGILFDYINTVPEEQIESKDSGSDLEEGLSKSSNESVELLQELECLERNGGIGILQSQEQGKEHEESKEGGSDQVSTNGREDKSPSQKCQEEEKPVDKCNKRKVTVLEVIDVKEDSINSVMELREEDSLNSVIEVKEDANGRQSGPTEEEITILEEVTTLETDATVGLDPPKANTSKRIVVFVDEDSEDSSQSPTKNKVADVVNLGESLTYQMVLTEKYRFNFIFGPCRFFKFLSDGRMEIFDSEILDNGSKEKCVKDLWNLILSKCLKGDVTEIEPSADPPQEKSKGERSAKRKSSDFEEHTSGKYLKLDYGEGKAVHGEMILVSKHKIRNRLKIWEGRKKMCKQLTQYDSSLESEIALSTLMEEKMESMELIFDFESYLWRDSQNLDSFWITCRPSPSVKKSDNHFNICFSFLENISRKCALHAESLARVP